MRQIAQAAIEELARYLGQELPGVEVRDRWFGPEESFERPKISVNLAGEPEHIQVLPTVTKVVPTTGENRLYTWRVNVLRQAIQLDLYAEYQATLDEASAALQTALRRGEGYTLDAAHVPPGVDAVYWGEPTRDGIILALDPAKGYAGFAAFSFDGGTPIADSVGAMTRDWREMWRGELGVDLLVTAETVRLARILLSQQTGIGELGSATTEETELE